MLIKKISLATGIEHVLNIDITMEQIERINNGEHIQYVCSHLSADDREFLISGTTAEEWNELFN